MTTTPQAGVAIHRGDDRGTTDHGWRHARHSFSFGHYHDPERNSFRSLRVLNDDIIDPGGGFGRHPHHNMEIISWMRGGALEHTDSSGQRGVIKAAVFFQPGQKPRQMWPVLEAVVKPAEQHECVAVIR